MLVLAIDTSTRSGSVALLRDQILVQTISGREDVPYSTRLFEDVALLQSRGDFRIGEVDLFAVATGPGSFTGLRVGLAAVKAWAEVYGKPIAAVSCLDAIAEQGSRAAPAIAAFLDARRGNVFCGIYDRHSADGSVRRRSEDAIFSVEQSLAFIRNTVGSAEVTLVTSSPQIFPPGSVEAILPAARIEPVSACLAPVIGPLGLLCAQRGELTDAAGLNANYVRRSDAEAAQRMP